MAKARRKSSTARWILLPDALALAVERYQSAELAKELLLRRPKQYRALSGDGTPVEGVSNFSDMRIDWAEGSARSAYQMYVLGWGDPPPSRRLYRIALLRADVLATWAVSPPRPARGRAPQHDRDAIRATAADVLKRGLPPSKTTFYEDVRTEYEKCGRSSPVSGNNRAWNDLIGDLYDDAKRDSCHGA